MPQAAIFDLDGTLVDSVDLHASAWQEALVKFGHPVTFEQARSQIGKGGDQLIPVFLSEADQRDHGAEMEEWRGTLFRSKYLPLVRPFSAVPELLRCVREAGLKVAVASSAKESELGVYFDIAGPGRHRDLVRGCRAVQAGSGHLSGRFEETGYCRVRGCRDRRYTLRCRSSWQSRNSHHWYAMRRLQRS